MKPQHKEILDIIEKYLEKYPEQRFSQALFNLKINAFTDDSTPQSGFKARDIYNDFDDDILERAKSAMEKDKIV